MCSIPDVESRRGTPLTSASASSARSARSRKQARVRRREQRDAEHVLLVGPDDVGVGADLVRDRRRPRLPRRQRRDERDAHGAQPRIELERRRMRRHHRRRAVDERVRLEGVGGEARIVAERVDAPRRPCRAAACWGRPAAPPCGITGAWLSLSIYSSAPSSFGPGRRIVLRSRARRAAGARAPGRRAPPAPASVTTPPSGVRVSE